MKEAIIKKLKAIPGKNFILQSEKNADTIEEEVNKNIIIAVIREDDAAQDQLSIEYFSKQDEPNIVAPSLASRIGALENAMPKELRRVQHDNYDVRTDFKQIVNVTHNYRIIPPHERGIDLNKDQENTLENFRALLGSIDDTVNTQFRVNRDGIFYVSTTTGNKNLDHVLFRLPTCVKGNGYVGKEAVQDDNWVQRIYKVINDNYPIPQSSFIDNF